MAVYEIKFEQKIPTTLAKAWDFISSPMNLKEITPAYMNFQVTSSTFKEKMYPGMMITYKVSPVLGLRLDWCTEITHVEYLTYFVDEQREGPYTIWHHQHHLVEVDGGVLMTDIIHYKVPFGILGKIANSLFVKKQLQGIFDFRFKKVEEIFGKMK
ncbi:MAG TPA: SRPBCC family protein [Chitinophagaceae bacterium]|nr:SRPBCC family protein [Chitinophagaceae bacterium]